MKQRRLVRSPYPRVVAHALRVAARVQVHRWDRALLDVRRVQETTLAELVQHARGTEFGRAHAFDQIHDYEDFARRVPLGDYDSFLHPLRIEFVGRLGGCLSVTQELTTHVEIERAVAHAASSCACTTLDFGAGADVGVEGSAKSRYSLFVEFQAGEEPSDLRAFAEAFDRALCDQNRVYREHRLGEVALLPPVIVPLARGGARRFLEQVTGGNVQGKFPRIVDDTKKKLLWQQVASPPAPGRGPARQEPS